MEPEFEVSLLQAYCLLTQYGKTAPFLEEHLNVVGLDISKPAEEIKVDLRTLISTYPDMQHLLEK